MPDDRLAEITAALADAERDLAEQRRLTERLVRAEHALGVAGEQVRLGTERLHSESADVARLESFSPTRIWAGLRGSRDADLDRERAEQQAAEYAVAAARARRDQAQREVDETQRALRALAGADVRRREALAAKEEHLRSTDHPAAAELAEVAAATGAARATLTELQEAGVAADHALARLGAAAELLGSARSWSTMDTFFDGGLLTDMVKYDRMDAAQQLMREADAALRHLAVELSDVGMAAVGGIEVTELTRAFDVWFDNIFSDWSVRNRITEAADRVAQAASAVQRVRASLHDRVAQQDADLRRLAARREQLLAE